MAWDFNGTDQYVRFTMSATLQGAAGGPMTLAGLVHLDATTDGAVIHLLSGTSSRTFLEIFGTWNYGTSAGARTGPAGTTSAWYIVIVSKDTGAVAPEYTLIPLATGIPVSGTITGGGVTLGDGTSSGGSGQIQVGRWATSATEYIDGRIAATAIWNSYKNQAAREALTTWALWSSGGTVAQWAVRYDTLSTLTDATGNGGGETGRFGTTMTLSADPSGSFFGGGGSTVNAVLAATLPAPAATLLATPRHLAVLTATLPAPVAAIAARPRHPAVLAAALPAPVAAIAARPRHAATLLATLPAPAGGLTATPRHPAVLAATLPTVVAAIVKDLTPYTTAVLTPSVAAAGVLTPGAQVGAVLTADGTVAATLTPSTL